jgi:hypothetical protein
MFPDSCALLKSFGVACVGPSASLVFGGAAGAEGLMAASEGGKALGGAATDGAAEWDAAPETVASGLGASVFFWQPVTVSNTAAAATQVLMVLFIVTSHEKYCR